MKRWWWALGLAAVALTACQSCSDQYRRAVRPLLAGWDEARTVADRTPGPELAGPIAELARIRQETLALSVPDCAAGTHELLLQHMALVIRGHTKFMNSNEDDGGMWLDTFEEATQAWEAWEQQVAGLASAD